MPHPSPGAIDSSTATRKEIFLQKIREGVYGLIHEGLITEKSFEIVIDVQDRKVKKTQIKHGL